MEILPPDIGNFYKYLNSHYFMSVEVFQKYIMPYLQRRSFEKKETITGKGEVENYFNYVVSGIARKFYPKGKDEINVQISTEGHMIHVQESFHSRLPSEFIIEAIEPVYLISISYDDLEMIYSSDPSMERLGRLVITHSMYLRDKWQMQMIKLSPRERFINFVDKNPELLQRVPQKYLASYLNIQPETFSRFKHLLKVKSH